MVRKKRKVGRRKGVNVKRVKVKRLKGRVRVRRKGGIRKAVRRNKGTYQQAYNRAYDQGFDEAYNEGFSDGYREGAERAKSLNEL